MESGGRYVEQIHWTGPNSRYTSATRHQHRHHPAENGVRAVLVWDKQPNNGAIPTFDTIFGQTSQAGVESASVMDHLPIRQHVPLQGSNGWIHQSNPHKCRRVSTRSTPQRQAWSTILTSDSTNMSSFETCSPTSVELQTPWQLQTSQLVHSTSSSEHNLPTLNELWAIEDTSTARLRYID